jgi:DUF4097 and DUF4098 domain-containing protein YvlB
MPRRTLVPALALTLALATSARADVLERRFEVAPGGTLTLDTDRGEIRVTATEASAVTVSVEREARPGGEESDHTVTFEQSGNDVIVTGETEREGLWGWRSSRVRVAYRIEVPRRFDLDLETAGGDVDIDGLEGAVRAETSGGDVELGSIAGPVDARTSGGNVVLAGSTGSAKLETSGGNVKIGEVEGSVDAETSGGDITIRRAQGDVRAETSGGNIVIEEVFGTIEAHSSGGDVRARLASQPEADCRLSTSGGDVVVELVDGIAANLDAATSGGSVSVEMPVTVSGTIGRSQLRGTLGSGGPLLHLRTSGGDIEIRKLTATSGQNAG